VHRICHDEPGANCSIGNGCAKVEKLWRKSAARAIQSRGRSDSAAAAIPRLRHQGDDKTDQK
jgi:hypothetical protein